MKKKLSDYGALNPKDYSFEGDTALAIGLLASVLYAIGEAIVEGNEEIKRFHEQVIEMDSNDVGEDDGEEPTKEFPWS